jgi:hypothetical protein
VSSRLAKNRSPPSDRTARRGRKPGPVRTDDRPAGYGGQNSYSRHFRPPAQQLPLQTSIVSWRDSPSTLWSGVNFRRDAVGGQATLQPALRCASVTRRLFSSR